MDAKEQRQELFNHLQNEHDLICLESELDFIIAIVESFATPPTRTITDKEIYKESLIYYPDHRAGGLNDIMRMDSGRSGFINGMKIMRDKANTPKV